MNKARHNYRGENSQSTLMENEKKYEKWFDKLVTMEQPKVIRRKNCKICNLPVDVREWIETYWDKCHNQSLVRSKLNEWAEKEETGMKFNKMNIRSHMLNHYEQQERQMWLEDYALRMRDMMNYKISKDQMFEGLSTSLQAQFLDVGADVTMDKNRQASSMVQLAKTLLDIAETQAKLRGDLKSAEVVAEKFKEIWVAMATKQDDPVMRKLLLENLNMFREEMSEIQIET